LRKKALGSASPKISISDAVFQSAIGENDREKGKDFGGKGRGSEGFLFP
jgi:hypothetical protein